MNTTIQPPSLGWYVPDEVFQDKCGPRWVLAVGNGHVLYSDGGKKTKECTLAKWDAWMHKYGIRKAQSEQVA